MEAAALNERVRYLLVHHRTNAGYSTEKMAKLLHMPEAHYRRIEGGAQRDIPILLINAFCAALQIPIHRFLLNGQPRNKDFIQLISQQWDLMCFLHETQYQLQELIDCLEQKGEIIPSQAGGDTPGT